MFKPKSGASAGSDGTGGTALYGALKYNESKTGEVLLTNEMVVTDGGTMAE